MKSWIETLLGALHNGVPCCCTTPKNCTESNVIQMFLSLLIPPQQWCCNALYQPTATTACFLLCAQLTQPLDPGGGGGGRARTSSACPLCHPSLTPSCPFVCRGGLWPYELALSSFLDNSSMQPLYDHMRKGALSCTLLLPSTWRCY